MVSSFLIVSAKSSPFLRSHAAIIVRMQKPSFDEGKVVVKHWLDEFEV